MSLGWDPEASDSLARISLPVAEKRRRDNPALSKLRELSPQLVTLAAQPRQNQPNAERKGHLQSVPQTPGSSQAAPPGRPQTVTSERPRRAPLGSKQI